ncbi:unnamed protein product, partial [Closterium sp. Naga37s-1]
KGEKAEKERPEGEKGLQLKWIPSGAGGRKAMGVHGMGEGAGVACRLCKEGYDESRFYVACNFCDSWFHGDTLQLDEQLDIPILLYLKCNRCRKIANKLHPCRPNHVDPLDWPPHGTAAAALDETPAEVAAGGAGAGGGAGGKGAGGGAGGGAGKGGKRGGGAKGGGKRKSSRGAGTVEQSPAYPAHVGAGGTMGQATTATVTAGNGAAPGVIITTENIDPDSFFDSQLTGTGVGMGEDGMGGDGMGMAGAAAAGGEAWGGGGGGGGRVGEAWGGGGGGGADVVEGGEDGWALFQVDFQVDCQVDCLVDCQVHSQVVFQVAIFLQQQQQVEAAEEEVGKEEEEGQD